MENHKKYIEKTFELAKLGLGEVSPNPLVGALIVKNSQIIGEGYHQKAGTPHAEVHALDHCRGEDLTDAILYCNLEPCCHTEKKTPPCVYKIIDSGIKKVVFSNFDPNPFVCGKGKKILEDHGIEVIAQVEEDQGKELNRVFFKFITTGLPYVHLKVAQSLDGKICTFTGDSKYITDINARKIVHAWRAEYDAVMVGKNTAIVDNPLLDTRLYEKKSKDPFKIIVGNDIPSSLNLFKNNSDKVLLVQGSPFEILSKLGRDQITSLLLEGGSQIISAFISEKLVDKISIFISPKLIGNGKPFFINNEIQNISESIHLKTQSLKPVGDQILWEGTL